MNVISKMNRLSDDSSECNKDEQNWQELFKLIHEMAQNSFIIYKSFFAPIQHLTDEQLGRLFRAIFQYQLDGTRQANKDIEMAFLFFVNQFELDKQKYDDICRNRGAMNGGGRPKSSSDDSTAQQDMQDSFVEFWNKYHDVSGLPKTDKDAAIKHWKRLTKSERQKAIDNINDYFSSLSNPRYCKKARTYLADKNFNDEFGHQSDGGFPVPR